jgi:nitrate/nitrite-specific signal transduction histidine kinase
MSKSDDDEVPDLEASKKEFIQTFFRRGAEFAEELMRENERLRYRVVQLEAELSACKEPQKPGSAQQSLRELVARIEALEHERAQLLERYEDVSTVSQEFTTRYHEIERENNNLANLYVASFQLHSTMDLREVTQIILEILLNFVGAKTFAIQLVDDERNVVRTLASEGVDKAKLPERPLGGTQVDKVAEVISRGEPYFDEKRLPLRADLERPAIIVPLRIREKVVGAIVVWDLLQQKTSLAEVDYELFNLLGAHAASALQGAKLTSELGGRPPALWAAADMV